MVQIDMVQKQYSFIELRVKIQILLMLSKEMDTMEKIVTLIINQTDMDQWGAATARN
jgi:hypothetical protein